MVDRRPDPLDYDDDDGDNDDDDDDGDDDDLNLWKTAGLTHLTKRVLPDWHVKDRIFGCSGALTSVQTFKKYKY